MKTSGYIAVNRGESYGYPYREAIESLSWCNQLVIGCDPRFDDGTVEVLKKSYASRFDVVIKEFDWDHPNPHGQVKQELRELCDGEWLVDLNPDEIFPEPHVSLVLDTLPMMPESIRLLAASQIYYFNGLWQNIAMPKTRPFISRNSGKLYHSIFEPNLTGLSGAAYITGSG